MVDRTGLHVAPVPGANPIGTAPVDGRLVQAALFGSTGQCLNGGGYSASSSTMAFGWNFGVYQIPDTANGGAVYHSPVDSAVLTPAAGQSGGRIDSVYVLQQDFEKNGSTSRVIYGLAAGTPGSGSAPSLSGIPGGPMRLANITVPASASKATDCTVNWVIPPATLATDGPVVANKALLDLLPGAYVDQRAVVGSVLHRWNGSAWKPWESDWTSYSVNTAGMPSSVTATGLYRYVGGDIEFQVAVTMNGTGGSGNCYFTLPGNYGPNARIRNRDVEISRPGSGSNTGTLSTTGSAVGNSLYLYVLKVDGTYAAPINETNGVPIAWQNGDQVFASGIYTPA